MLGRGGGGVTGKKNGSLSENVGGSERERAETFIHAVRSAFVPRTLL